MGALRVRRACSFLLLGLTWIGLLAAAQAASASPQLPASAQGHPYRHGRVPFRGQQSTPPTQTSSENLSYGGGISGVGVTTGAPKVYLVFWGSQWGTQGTDAHGYVTLSGDPDGMAPYLQAFIKGLGTGGETWSGVMTQYCQGISAGAASCPSSNAQHVGYPRGGALAGVWVDESAAAPALASGHQIGAEAVSAATHFGNTTSSANRNAQYVVVSPTGTNPDDWQSPTTGFCGWHDYTGDGTLSGGAVSSPDGPLAFTNLPYITDAGPACGQNFVNPGTAGTLDGVSITEGHEYAETITDQFPAGGWTIQDSSSVDYGYENGDLCAWISTGQGAAQNLTLSTGSFAVQSTWANDSGACEISHPIVNNVTVSNPGNQASAPGQPITPLQISASDSDSTQTLTYSATNLPSGLTISSSTGQITGSPTASAPGLVTVTAADATGASGSASFSWTVGHSTSTSASCSPNPVALGSATTCSATVSDTSSAGASAPTGTVSFLASPGGGATPCTLIAISATTAKCQTTYTPTAAGSETLSAAYGGDGSHAGSSNSTSLTVTAPPTTGGGGSIGSTASTGSSGSSGSTGSTGSSAAGGAGGSGGAGTQTSSPTNAGGGGASAASIPGAVCASPAGHLNGSTLWLVTLGMTRAQARRAYLRGLATSSRYQDLFCLSLRVGYPSPGLLKALSVRQRGKLSGRVIWVVTTSSRYAVRGLRTGARVATAKSALRTGTRFRIRGTTWYLFRRPLATLLVGVRGGVVREIGIAATQLTRAPRATSLLLRSLP